MSQVTHTPGLQLGQQVKGHWHVVAATLVALLAALAVALIVANDSESPTAPVAVQQQQPAVRADGGPEETSVATAVAPKVLPVRPDESNVAAAISRPETSVPLQRPDESTVAAAISRPETSLPSQRPDESVVAAAISRPETSLPSQRPDESVVANSIKGR